MPALTHDANCCICHGKMKAGENFRWYQKPGEVAAARGASRKERWLPMHDNPSVCRQVMHAPTPAEIEAKAEADRRIAAVTAGMMAGTMTAEQALAMLGYK